MFRLRLVKICKGSAWLIKTICFKHDRNCRRQNQHGKIHTKFVLLWSPPPLYKSCGKLLSTFVTWYKLEDKKLYYVYIDEWVFLWSICTSGNIFVEWMIYESEYIFLGKNGSSWQYWVVCKSVPLCHFVDCDAYII
mgnify:CR=1 FL=1